VLTNDPHKYKNNRLRLHRTYLVRVGVRQTTVLILLKLIIRATPQGPRNPLGTHKGLASEASQPDQPSRPSKPACSFSLSNLSIY